jgi:hypothetical protein
MALQGNYTHYIYESHPTETETISIAYPADLSENEPNYDKRGTTEDIIQLKLVEVATVHENCTIGLRTVNAYVIANDDQGNKVVSLSYNFRVYNNSQEKQNFFNEDFDAEYYGETSVDLNENTNLWEFCYNQIKSSKGGSELINI